MGRLISLTETLNQPLTEGEVVKAIGQGALILSEASRALLVVRQADGTVACPWSQGIASAYITQALTHLRDLPAGQWMTNVGDDVVELPGGGLVRGMQPALLSDGHAQPAALVSKLAPAEGSRAAAIWSLTCEGRTIGLMACHYDSPRAWSRPELDVLHVFFRQAGAALENVRLYEARAQRTAELEALLDLSKRLRAAHSLEEMSPLLLEHSRRLLRADHSTLAFLEPHHEAFTRVHSAGLPSIGHGAIIPIQGTLLGRVVQTGTPLRIDDVADESDPELSCTAPSRDLGAVVVMPVHSEDEIIGALAVGRARGPERRPFTEADVSVLQGIAEIGGTAIQRARLDGNLEQAYVQMVLALAHSTAPRDSHTALQNFHLMTLAEETARAVGAGEDVIEDIRWGARLHDIGKVGVPDSILNKRGPLTERERAVLLRHPVIGEEILARVARMRGVAKLVRHHQEHWDGTGYPDGLRGEEIPMGARILSVVDAYRGLLEAAHQPPRTHDDAVAEIRKSAGTRFDPMIVDVFYQTVERVRSIDEPVA
jgi:HD-GYP domain-containing protein (c-di-GMP phosphodiesterase class II)